MTSVVDGQKQFFAAYVRLSETDNITNTSFMSAEGITVNSSEVQRTST